MRVCAAIVMLGCVACEQKSGGSAAAPDPWAGAPSAPAKKAADPWSAPSAPATAAPPSAPAPNSGGDTSVDGTWVCWFLGTIMQNGFVMPQYNPMPGFTISHGTYTSTSGDGTVEVDASYVEFHGAGFSGWRAARTLKDGRTMLVFHGDTHRDGTPGDTARFGDIKCDQRP